MKLPRLAPLVLTLMTGAAVAEVPLSLPEIDYIRVEKSARAMQLIRLGGWSTPSKASSWAMRPKATNASRATNARPRGAM